MELELLHHHQISWCVLLAYFVNYSRCSCTVDTNGIVQVNICFRLDINDNRHTTFVLQAEIERIVDDGSLDDHVDSFLTHDDTDRQDPVGRDVTKGYYLYHLELWNVVDHFY